MTKEGAEIIRGAMRAISEQCKSASSCDNCPLFDWCLEEVGLFEISPDCWFSGGGLDGQK